MEKGVITMATRPECGERTAELLEALEEVRDIIDEALEDVDTDDDGSESELEED